jgi:predicted signal transduction protein with EAL and GGDEF domain
VCASVGIAVAEKGETFDQVLKHADLALYDAKAAGRGVVRVRGPRHTSDEASALFAREP